MKSILGSASQRQAARQTSSRTQERRLNRELRAQLARLERDVARMQPVVDAAEAVEAWRLEKAPCVVGSAVADLCLAVRDYQKAKQ